LVFFFDSFSVGFFIKSCPQNAETIINKVDFGVCNHTRWDREIMWRKTNLLVHPSKGFKVFCDETELSTARIDVVPTVQRFFWLWRCSQYRRPLA
jgi:hypothetical protein